MPLAIENPQVSFVGMDARKKKIDAIWDMIQSLEQGSQGLANVSLVWSRVEEYRGPKFDIVMARAVAHVEKLLPWMLSIVQQ